jgi:murein DD-endopeptidase MepM/ murein hydrolase activator NlpD
MFATVSYGVRPMSKPLLLPSLLAGGLVVISATTGLTHGDGSEPSSDAPSMDPIAVRRAVRSPDPTTTTTAPPTTTTTAPPPPPPTTTTTAPPPPPEPEPEPEPEVDVSAGGGIVCPVAGPVEFVDSWGDARSGGRGHQGTDMMADHGTPTVAPVSGTVEHRSSSLGGLSWYVHGDDGDTYYGTHLSGYENEGAGRVEAGTVIGYVGDSGNAGGTPHLHFEHHPGGGSPINSYPLVVAAC